MTRKKDPKTNPQDKKEESSDKKNSNPENEMEIYSKSYFFAIIKSRNGSGY